jgi:hypothetical protein
LREVKKIDYKSTVDMNSIGSTCETIIYEYKTIACIKLCLSFFFTSLNYDSLVQLWPRKLRLANKSLKTLLTEKTSSVPSEVSKVS